MKILVLNPNTSQGITETISGVARGAAAPGTELDFATAENGVPYIATRTEALIAGREALEILARRARDYDAAILAAFGDPGLGAIREIIPIPVVGLAEASLLMAAPLGRRISIVTFSVNLEAWYRECVEWHRMDHRLASIRTPDAPFGDVGSVQSEFADRLVDLAERAVREDGADVIITAGAPLAGLASRVRDRVPVPLVEGVAAAVKIAEAMVTLDPRPPKVGTFARPVAKSSVGLPPALADLLAAR